MSASSLRRVSSSSGSIFSHEAAADAAHADRERTRYAHPRFVEIVPDLPKTPAAKVQKAKLLERGMAPGKPPALIGCQRGNCLRRDCQFLLRRSSRICPFYRGIVRLGMAER